MFLVDFQSTYYSVLLYTEMGTLISKVIRVLSVYSLRKVLIFLHWRTYKLLIL